MKTAVAVALACAVGCSRSASEPVANAGSPAAPTTQMVLGAMARLAGAVPDPEKLTAWARNIDRGQATVDAYIDELLAQGRFAHDIVPALVFGPYASVRNYFALPSAFVLKKSVNGTLYLRSECSPSDTVIVRPWWDLASEIRVCPDAYKPDVWTVDPEHTAYKAQTVLACDSQIGSPELETAAVCGCGPNLIRCVRDSAQYDEFNRSLLAEVNDTTAYVVDHDLPMSRLFTDEATFRDRNAELYYRRQKIGALELTDIPGELASIDQWPQTGAWAPRPEVSAGQHAGLLTAPQVLHSQPDRRQRQRGYYELMWCNLKNSFGASTHTVLEINANGNNFFAHDSWERLAHTPLCTNCHARLDYGFQFFLGYPDSRASTHYVPSLVRSGSGPLYAENIDDPRGEAPLTPQAFAQKAVGEPEFASCMTDHFVEYVLGDRATSEDIDAITTAVTKTGTFKAVMRVALQRYAARWKTAARAAAMTPVVAMTATGDQLSVTPPLRKILDDRCVDCHDGPAFDADADHQDKPVDLRGPMLPRALVVRMADQVSFHMMPKDQPLPDDMRDELVRMLVASLWAEPAARAEALDYYLGRSRALPAQQLDNALHAVDTAAGAATPAPWGALERAISPEQATLTPGFLAVTALEALRACATSAAGKPDALAACLERSTSLDALSRSPAP